MELDECEKLMRVLQKMIDRDGKGYIDYSEFISLSIEHKKLLTRDNLTKAFSHLDVDSSGQVSIKELRKAFEAAGTNKRSDKFWQELVGKIDKTEDSQISLEEFV